MFKALQISWLTPISAAQKRSGDVMLLSHRGKGNYKADVSSVGFWGLSYLCVYQAAAPAQCNRCKRGGKR